MIVDNVSEFMQIKLDTLKASAVIRGGAAAGEGSITITIELKFLSQRGTFNERCV